MVFSTNPRRSESMRTRATLAVSVGCLVALLVVLTLLAFR